MAITLASQLSSDGSEIGRAGRLRSGSCNTLTNRVKLGPAGSFANGSFAASFSKSPAGQIMISHLKGNLRANAARRVDSLTALRTTKVPTAPRFTTSNFESALAISAGRHRFAVPTFTARRKTTEATGKVRSKKEKLRNRKGVKEEGRSLRSESRYFKYLSNQASV